MALGSIPPWISVSPADFVHAAAAGAQLGHAIADSTLRAWEEQARMRMAAQEATARREQQAQQHAVETAMARLAADRLEAYRQQEVANRKAELGLQQQGLGLRGEALDVARQRAEDALKLGEGRLTQSQEREADRQAQRDFRNEMAQKMQDYREKGLSLREESMNRPRQSHFFTGPDGVQYMVEPGSTNAVPVNLPKKEAEQGGSSSLMDMYKGVMGLGAKISGLSNFLPQSAPTPPPAPAPAKGLSYAPQETQAAPPPAPAPAAPPKKRVKVKGPKGQTGTVEEGDTLPEGWKISE